MALSAEQAEQLADDLSAYRAKLYAIVHGGAAETVETDGGTVKTVAKVIADADAQLAAHGATLAAAMDTVAGYVDEAESIRDSLVNVIEFKGAFDASGGSWPADPDIGDYYTVTVSGTVASVDLVQGDEIIYGPSGWIVVGRALTTVELETLLSDAFGAKMDAFSGWMGFSATEAPPQISNLNSVTGSGLSWFDSSAEHRPSELNIGYLLQAQRSFASLRITQIAFSANFGDVRVFVRQLYSGEWTDWSEIVTDRSTVEVESSLSDKITAPKRIKSPQERYSLLDFGNARGEMAKDENLRDLSSAAQKMFDSGHMVYVPPGRYPMQVAATGPGSQPCAVYLSGDQAINIECADDAHFVVTADWDAEVDEVSDMMIFYPDGFAGWSGDQTRWRWRGGRFDGNAWTAAHGDRWVSGGSGPGFSFLRCYRYLQPTLEDAVIDGGFTTPAAGKIGAGAVDTGWQTHQCFGELANRNTFIGLYDLCHYPNGLTLDADLAANPIVTVAGSPTVTVEWPNHPLKVNEVVTLSGVASVGGLTISGNYAVTEVPDTNHFKINVGANASSGATGGGASVYAQAFTASKAYATFVQGTDLAFTSNRAYRCGGLISAKRSSKAWRAVDNYAYECGAGIRSQEGGDLADTGVNAQVVRNRLIRTQGRPIELRFGEENLVSENYIEDWGYRIEDGTTLIGGAQAAIALANTHNGRVRDNIIRAANWYTGQDATNYLIGIQVYDHAAYGPGFTTSLLQASGNTVIGARRGVSEEAGVGIWTDNPLFAVENLFNEASAVTLGTSQVVPLTLSASGGDATGYDGRDFTYKVEKSILSGRGMIDLASLAGISGTAVIIKGLPTALQADANLMFPVTFRNVTLNSGYTHIIGFMNISVSSAATRSEIKLFEVNAAGNWQALAASQLSTNSWFAFDLAYRHQG